MSAGQIVASPERSEPHSPAVTRAERRQLLERFGAGADVPFPANTFVHDLIEQQAQRTPDAVALIFEGQQLTYRQLARQANQLAHHLRGLGVGPDTLVGVAMERSVELVVALLGILKASGAYVPLDPDYPPDRLAFMLADTRVPVLLTQQRLVDRLPPHDARTLCLDAPWEALRHESAAAPATLGLEPGHLAYVIYTSGSTGRPKGALNTHRGLSNRLLWMQDAYRLCTHDRVLQKTPFSFDVSVWEFFWPLLAGATMVVARPRGHQDAGYLARLIAREAVTTVHFVPPMLSVFLDEPELAVNCRTLRQVICSGEALAHELQQRFFEAFPRPEVKLHNLYGPTEAAIDVTAWECQRDPADPVVPIGKPIANTRIYLLDPQGEPVRIGEPGELHIGGVAVGRGYLGRPDLTAEKFIPDPFRDEPSARLYKTGDLARWRADGNIIYLGRLDQQVKVRGFRIELGEIEAAIAAQPGVSQSVVTVREDQPGERRLTAYFVAPEGADRETLAPRIRSHLQERLPEYMVPAAFVRLDTLPLTHNGKIDRQALPAPAGTGLSAAEYVAPVTPEEMLLCQATAELLGLERVGLADHFFLLGGHSLLAARLAARVRERLGRELPLATIFDHPRLGDLAQALRALHETVDESTPLLAASAEAHRSFPLTTVQEAYWLGRQRLVELGEVACHVYLELRVAALDLDRFTFAWREVIARHPMLRAIVGADGRQQVLAEVAPLAITFADHSGQPAAAAAALAVREAMSHQVPPSDRWPLFEVRVTRVAAQDWRVHLSFDALILDDHSANLLLEEVFAIYAGRPPASSPAGPTFRDYVLYVQGPAFATARARDLDYWQARLETLPAAPALPLAVDPSRLADPHFSRRHASLDPAVWDRLKARATAAALTPSNLLLTAYAEVLGTWARTDDFTLNLTVADRRPVHPAVEQMLGVFTNLTPLEIRGARQGSFLARALAQQRQLVRDLDHRSVSGVEIQRLLAQRLGDPQAGVLPVVFSSLLGEKPAQLPAGVEIVHSLTETPQTWLENTVSDRAGALQIDWDAPAKLFPPGLLEAMLTAYVGLLHELAGADAAWETTSRSLLPAAQRELFAAVNATAGPLPAGLLHDPIFAAADAAPEATAVIDATETLSYGELTRRARLLAHRLQATLEPADQLVAIVMEKGWEQIAAALAVLENGRAFLPISAAQPDQRIQAILTQAGVRVVLTQPRILQGRAWSERVTSLEVAETDASTGAPPRLPRTAVPADPAYVIYTSGSTGIPKGVTIQHLAARNTIADLVERFAFNPGDLVLWVSSFEFDLSIFDLFGVLAAGGAVVVPAPGGSQNPLIWAEAVQRHKVTVWNSVPAIAELVLSAAGTDPLPWLSSLRLMMLSGDWIPVPLAVRLRDQLPGCRLYSLGGATEASIWSIFHPIERVDPQWVGIPYGKPLRNQTFHVLHADLAPCPIHTTGKLFIGGLGLALSYWRDPVQTAARFIIHPQTGRRLYDTGDLGRYLPDGTIEFLGRDDQQVKLRGYRIELGEVEAVLCQHPHVRHGVAVIQRQGEIQRIVAYVVPAVGAPELGTLREWLLQRLPDYMVPATIVPLAELPLTANGKVDRRALPEPDLSAGAGTADGRRGPETPLERYLGTLWGEILGRETVDVQDNFFATGGDSLSGVRMVNRLREYLDEPLSLVVIFEAPTICELAVLLRANYAAALRRRGLQGGDEAAADSAGSSPVPRVGLAEADIAQMRQIASQADAPVAIAPAERNPRAAFILSPMRSGSTLLRIMLAGHPQLFSPPELQLLPFETLAERRDAFSGYERYLQEGTLRALMQVYGLGLEAARTMMAAREAAGCSVREFYRELQAAIAPALLVDKTPEYAMDLNVLRRAETYFADPLYIHLARHPLGMIRSYEQGRFLLESPYRGRHDFSARQMGELTWLISHRNILDFLGEVAPERQRLIRFEDIVAAPETAMRMLGDFLGVGYDPGMVRPYENGRAKMTDGVHPESVQVGDAKFYRHGALAPEVADQWQADYQEDFLCAGTWEIARTFGYENPFEPVPAAPAARTLSSITAVAREPRLIRR